MQARLTMRPLFRILGSLEVEGAGPLGGPQQRELLRRLLLAANTVVPVDRLVDDVWGGAEPPEHAREALQVYVSRLRKAIPDGQKRIRWEQGGYRIAVEENELDAHRFERLVAEGRSLLAAADATAAASAFDEALGLWRGPLDVEGSRAPELARLEELRLSSEEDRIDAELARSRVRELVAELERLVAQEPLRERRRRQLMLALYRSGRQAEALAAYRDARRALVEELGLEPSAELRELEAAILRQDPALTVEPAELRARRRLPAPATPLIGRRHEIAEVCGLLGGETRLVTLTGRNGQDASRHPGGARPRRAVRRRRLVRRAGRAPRSRARSPGDRADARGEPAVRCSRRTRSGRSAVAWTACPSPSSSLRPARAS